MEGWEEFAVITGGAAAALVGLLFVAVSIRADVIATSRALRARLAQILTIFLGVLAASIAIALPDQSVWVLGIELIVVSVLVATALIVLDHRAERSAVRQSLERVLDRINPNVTTTVLIGLTGLGLVLGFEAALYVLALAVVVGFIGGVIGAWFVLVRPGG